MMPTLLELSGMYSAVKEDAIRAVETKNGAALQGRKIKVELAKRRAPLDARHPKGKRKGAALHFVIYKLPPAQPRFPRLIVYFLECF